MVGEEEDVQRIALEYEQYKAQIEALQEGLNLIEASVFQINATIESLEGARSDKKEQEILLPVGSDSFLIGKLVDGKNAIVGVGAGVAVKKPIEEAIKELEERRADLEKVRVERAGALEKAVSAASKIAPLLQEFMARNQQSRG